MKPDNKSPDTHYIADQMAIAMAGLLAHSKNAFHGLASPLPAVAMLAAKKLYNPSLLCLNIAGGVNAVPCPPRVSTCSPEYSLGGQSFFSLTDIFDFCARGKLDTAFLGGVQIDKQGRVNNSVIGSFSQPKVKLPGGAGSAVIVPTAKRVILWRAKHDVRSFVEKCSFVTAAGNIERVVTPLGILKMARKSSNQKELVLEGYFSYSSVDEIIKNTGFELDCQGAKQLPPPADNERKMLESIDPEGVRFAEF